MSTDFTFADVLVEVSETPEIFNELSPEAREFLLHWRPGDRREKPGTAATLVELSDEPKFFNALSPEAREFLLYWHPSSNL
jgi:hypothetical protein